MVQQFPEAQSYTRGDIMNKEQNASFKEVNSFKGKFGGTVCSTSILEANRDDVSPTEGLTYLRSQNAIFSKSAERAKHYWKKEQGKSLFWGTSYVFCDENGDWFAMRDGKIKRHEFTRMGDFNYDLDCWGPDVPPHFSVEKLIYFHPVE